MPVLMLSGKSTGRSSGRKRSDAGGARGNPRCLGPPIIEVLQIDTRRDRNIVPATCRTRAITMQLPLYGCGM